MNHCPNCNSKFIRRSRTRSRWERWRKEITDKRPYRCRACDWRGWMAVGLTEQDLATSHDRSMAPDPPNLGGTVLARAEPRAQVNLKALDQFRGDPEKSDS